MKVELELLPPMFPRFIAIADLVGENEQRIDVGRLTDEQARQYWNGCADAFVRHVAERRRRRQEQA